MEQIVRPGIETGVFYLVLGGLEFDADWRDLRAFARANNIDVEHAEVYPNRQGGWLRILDHQTFLRAFEIFNGSRIRKNPMLAFADNDTQPTVLMYPPPAMRRSPQHQNYGLAEMPHPVYMVVPAPYNLAGQSNLVPSQHVMPAQQVQFQQFAPYHVASIQYDGVSTSAGSELSFQESGAISIEARKVIVTQLPNNMTTSLLREVIEWIMKGCRHNHPAAVESVQIPRHRDGRLRSHAFVILQSHKLAKYAEKSLNGYNYYGKKLEARLTKEGAPSTSRKSRNSNGRTSSVEAFTQQLPPSFHSSSTGEEQEGMESPPKACSTPVVVNGSGSDSSHQSRPRH